jgi:hypothetical protein
MAARNNQSNDHSILPAKILADKSANRVSAVSRKAVFRVFISR